MKALIKTTANEYGHRVKQLSDYLVANRGKYVEIDTEHLFENQYNTVDGFRIYDTHIEHIIDDARVGIPEFENCFFIKNPQGHDPIKKFNIMHTDHKKAGYGSAYSVNGNYYRISRRSSIEFVLVKGVPYITNGIGYRKYKGNNDNERRIVKNVVKLIDHV